MFHRVKSETQNDQTDQEVADDTGTQEKEAAAKEQSSRPTPSQGYTAPQTDTRERGEGGLDIPAPAYQQRAPHHLSPSRPVTPSYPKAYPSAPSYSAPSSSSSASEAADNDRRLTIGRGITMSGEIEHCDYLLVEGTVEAALKGANALNIAETGTFFGTVEIEDAVIAGRFEGEIVVHGRLTIKSSGVITGSISYKELEVEAGAVIDGRLTPVSGAASQSREPSKGSKNQAQAKAKQTVKTAKTAAEPANSDGELFSKDMSAAE